MQKTLALFIVILTLISCKSTIKVLEHPTDYSILVGSREFKGVIFLDNATCLMCLQGKNKFSPTIEDISKAEGIVEMKLKQANNPLLNQGQGCPIIHKNLNNYRRQYFGYTDENGDRIIYVTFTWDRYTLINRLKGIERNETEKWKTEPQVILDGCSYHWQTKVNLSKEKLFELSINGIA